MPELPDITVYIERMDALLTGRVLKKVRLASPFLLRTAVPPVTSAEGKVIEGFERIGKRIVWRFESDLYFVLHLMIAGRLRWKEAGVAIPHKLGLAAFDFDHGSLLLTEAGTKKRASLHVVQGRDALAAHDPGGIDVLGSSLKAFSERMQLENRTLKRALTDPRLLSGIGNAYSDEILHHARLSPVKLTRALSDDELNRLHKSCQDVLKRWTQDLRDEVGDGFPDKVTAFREGMAMHGRYGEPCPDCGTKVQRIKHADNETNYCPSCQTDGKLLADRALSALLKKDWPKTLTELEEMKAARKAQA